MFVTWKERADRKRFNDAGARGLDEQLVLGSPSRHDEKTGRNGQTKNMRMAGTPRLPRGRLDHVADASENPSRSAASGR
jgi:hypothetical protein